MSQNWIELSKVFIKYEILYVLQQPPPPFVFFFTVIETSQTHKNKKTLNCIG